MIELVRAPRSAFGCACHARPLEPNEPVECLRAFDGVCARTTRCLWVRAAREAFGSQRAGPADARLVIELVRAPLSAFGCAGPAGVRVLIARHVLPWSVCARRALLFSGV